MEYALRYHGHILRLEVKHVYYVLFYVFLTIHQHLSFYNIQLLPFIKIQFLCQGWFVNVWVRIPAQYTWKYSKNYLIKQTKKRYQICITKLLDLNTMVNMSMFSLLSFVMIDMYLIVFCILFSDHEIFLCKRVFTVSSLFCNII